MANEDVTVLGQSLADLHHETLTTELRGDLAEDYQLALDAYERAKDRLRTVTDDDDPTPVLAPILEDGRFHLACVLARQEGRPLPERLPSCFFNPQHGPSHTEVPWTPLRGVERSVPVCLADHNRLQQDKLPVVRMVRVGTDLVPWYVTEEAFSLVNGEVDMRAVKEMHRHNQGQAMRQGYDVNTAHGNDAAGLGFF